MALYQIFESSFSGNATDALLLEPPLSDEHGAQPKRTSKATETTASSDKC